MTYEPYFKTLALTTPTGLKQQPIPLIHITSSLLANTLVISLQKCSQEKGRTYHIFGLLVLSAGPRYLLLMEAPNLTLEVLNVDFLGMPQGVGIIRYRTSHLVESSFCMMLSLKRANLATHQQVWERKQSLCLR